MENTPQPGTTDSVGRSPSIEVPIGNRILSSFVDLFLFSILFLIVWGFWAFLVPDQGPFPGSRAGYFFRDGREFALAVGPLRFVSVASGPMYLCFVVGAFVAGSGILPGHRLFAAKVERSDGGAPIWHDRFAREFLRTFSLLSAPGAFLALFPMLLALAIGGGQGRIGWSPSSGSLPGFVEISGIAILVWNAGAYVFGGRFLHDRLSGTILVRDPTAPTRPRRVLRCLLDFAVAPVAFLALYALVMLFWSQLC